jgi:hypothetical protein
MVHIFICPDCRSEHTEPAHAGFVLAVLCLDCTLALEMHELGRDDTPIAAAA